MISGRTMIANIIYIYIAITLCTLIYGLQISKLNHEHISEASHASCVITIPDALLVKVEEDGHGELLSLLSSATEAFMKESKVVFYNVDFSHVPKSHTIMTSIDYENSFVVFKHLRKDRTCLLTPESTNNNLKPDVYSFKKDTDYDLQTIVDFINDKCLTFRKINGNPTPQGIHEAYILDNLFSVSKHGSDSIDNNVNIDTPTPNNVVTDNSHTDMAEKNGVDHDLFCAANVDGINENDCVTVDDSAKTYESVDTQPDIPRHCDRIPIPTSASEFLNDFVTASRPVIITGATSHWNVFKKWNNQYLREKYGDIKVHIKITPNGQYEGVESTAMWENKSRVKIPQDVLKQLPFPDLVVVRPATMEIQFSEFIHLIESIASSKSSNISAYLEYSSISYFGGLEKDISEMSFIDGVLDLKHTNVWLSDGNTVGKLHFDPFDNFMCQISGEKEFILYDPHDNERLYEAHIQEAILSYNTSSKNFSRQKLMESTSMVMSPVDIEKPHYERFPRFAEAKSMSCKIQPGDVLFTPAFWWHEVRSKPSTTEHRNLAVNFWYDPFFLKEFPCQECKLYVNPKYFHLL